MSVDVPFDDLLAELVLREESIASFSRYVEYVSGLVPPPHLRLVCEKLDAVSRGEIKRLMISMPPGHGKQIDDNEIVLTSTGLRRHGDLRVGDFVFSPTGGAVRVLGVSDPGPQDCEVAFFDGSVVRCHERHEWTVYDRSCGKWRTLETQKIESQGLLSGGRARFQLPTVGPIQCEKSDLPVEPYFLGVWLGDGRSDAAQICGSAEDLLHIVGRISYKLGSSWVHKTTGVVYQQIIGVMPLLRAAGVLNGKHIPEVYFWAHEADRRALLAGLVDTDGSVSTLNQKVRFRSGSMRLAEDVAMLVRTFGYRASVDYTPPDTRDRKIKGGESWCVQWTPHDGLGGGTLPRKVVNRIRKRRLIGIKAIRRVEKHIGRCIHVDAEDGLYLVGRNLIATHNSFAASHYFPAYYLAKNPTKNVIFATHKQELSDSFGLKVRNVVKGDEHRRLFPDVGISPDKTAAGEWMTTAAGGYHATAVGANVTGRRGDILIGDDLLSGIQAAESEGERNKLWAWWGADMYTRRKNKDTPIVLIGTRWHLGDLMGRLDQAERDGQGEKWERVILPALAVDRDILGRKPGDALWPEQFPEEELANIRRQPSTTSRIWSSLYQQNPVVDDGGIIDQTWFKWWRSPEPPKVKYVLQAWDTALTANKTSAFSAATTWGVFDDDNGIPNLILLSAWRDRAEWPVLRRMCQRMATDYRDDNYKLPIKPSRERAPDTVLVEAKANGQMLIQDLGRAGIVATPFNPDRYGDKIARVRLVTDLIENGRVWLPTMKTSNEQLRPWARDFMEQCVKFPAADSRDWVDTMTMAFLRIKQSGWVQNTEDPYEPTYDTPLERQGFYW